MAPAVRPEPTPRPIRFEVVSVAAGNGRVRWRAPASPSGVDHGVGLHIGTVQDGRTVVWMQPGRVYPDGDVSVVAADTGTGARRWSYGGGRIRLTSAPSACRGQAAVCFVAYSSGSQPPRSLVLDAGTGRVLAQGNPPFQGSVRSIADGLYAASGLLAAIDDRGRLLWHRTITEAFGGAKVDPNYGWSIQLRDGRYVGSLGRIRTAAESAGSRIKIQDLAVTAGLDAKTGRTLWTRRASVFCGQLSFDLAHPVLCETTGEANSDGTHATNLDVALVGIDPATGENRWRADVGAVQGLLHGGSDVIRTAESAYALRTPTGVVALDLNGGIQTTPAADTGWCTADASVTPAQNVDGVNPATSPPTPPTAGTPAASAERPRTTSPSRYLRWRDRRPRLRIHHHRRHTPRPTHPLTGVAGA